MRECKRLREKVRTSYGRVFADCSSQLGPPSSHGPLIFGGVVQHASKNARYSRAFSSRGLEGPKVRRGFKMSRALLTIP